MGERLRVRLNFYDKYISEADNKIIMHDQFLAKALKTVEFGDKSIENAIANQRKKDETLAYHILNSYNKQKSHEVDMWRKISLMKRRAALQMQLDREKLLLERELHANETSLQLKYMIDREIVPKPCVPPEDSLDLCLQPSSPEATEAPRQPLPRLMPNVRDIVDHPHWSDKVRVPTQMIKRPIMHVEALKEMFPYYRGLTRLEKMEIEREERRMIVDEQMQAEKKRIEAKRRKAEQARRDKMRKLFLERSVASLVSYAASRKTASAAASRASTHPHPLKGTKWRNLLTRHKKEILQIAKEPKTEN